MSYESMIQAAIQAVRQRSVIRPSLDDLAKAAVDAALGSMQRVWYCHHENRLFNGKWCDHPLDCGWRRWTPVESSE